MPEDFLCPSAATSCTIRSCAGACPRAAPRSIARTCRDGSTRRTEEPAQTPAGSCAGRQLFPNRTLRGLIEDRSETHGVSLTTRRRPMTWSSTRIRPWRWGRTPRGDGGSSRATTTTTTTTTKPGNNEEHFPRTGSRTVSSGVSEHERRGRDRISSRYRGRDIRSDLEFRDSTSP